MNQATHLDPPYLDDEEKEMMEAFNRGEFSEGLTGDALESQKEKLRAMAKETLKRRSINIRVNERDIQKIQAIASRDGIPYQTLITSIIHRYAEGTLRRADP